ncbi:hypothetical protein LUZ60_001746 [Juncus effusus]|nr:hypothetical protein LUZ60_001746 [Juncus effusus]
MARRALEASSSLTWRPFFLSPSIRSLSRFHDSVRNMETLAYEEIRAEESEEKPFNRTAFVLHGLLGSGRNWRSFSRSLASELQNRSPQDEWRLVLVDLRNHGRSAGIKGLNLPHDMANSARDLANLVKSRNWPWPDVVIGHSLGGKVAFDFASSCANGKYGQSTFFPKQLWVLDSVPCEVKSENSDGEVEKVLHTLKKLSLPISSRQWVVEHMINLGFSKGLSQWIGSNLQKSGENLTWSFDLNAAIEMFNSYRETNYWSLLENPPKQMEINIVRAENSDRWRPDVVRKLEGLSEEKKVLNHILEKSGHWVHVDNPKGLIEIMAPRFAI